MTLRLAMASMVVIAALAAGPARAQPRPLTVSDLVGKSLKEADSQFNGALRAAWTGVDGTVVYLTTPGQCRFTHHGETLPLALLTRDGRVEAVLRRSGPSVAFNHQRRPHLSPSDDPLAPLPGALPMDDGLAATTGRLEALALPAEAVLETQCSAGPPVFAPMKPSEGLQSVVEAPAKIATAVWFAPVWLFGVPAENRSREIGRAQGSSALAEVILGQPLAGGAEGFRDRRREVVRLHAGSGDYVIVSIDLGGPPGRGISLPREVVFVGVRGGVVEWFGDGKGGVGQSLCTVADGRFGGRKGCSTTGYYNPRI